MSFISLVEDCTDDEIVSLQLLPKSYLSLMLIILKKFSKL